MANTIEVKVPDIGGYDDVPVIEVLVAVGDRVARDQGLVTLESDKATMEVPSPEAGVVTALNVKVGDRLSEGGIVATLELGVGAADGTPAGEPPAAVAAPGAVQPATRPAGATAQPGPGGAAAETGVPGIAEADPEQATAAGNRASRAPSAPPATAAADSGRKADVDCALVVLGSGPGGYAAAFRAADLGVDTVLVERHAQLGGVCLNVGCIPSKALLHAAAVIDEAAHAADFGITFGKPEIALDALRAHKSRVVAQFNKGLAGMARQRKVRVETGNARFVSPNELEVAAADGAVRLLRFAHCIIAAGSQALKLPGFPWDDPRVMDSTDALELADVPARLLVVGGGIIGLEMATVYRALGSDVTVVELADQLMPGADLDLVKPLADRLKKQGVSIHLKTKVTAVEARPEGLVATLEGDTSTTATFDRILVAVGRRPNGPAIGAERAGVVVDERGFVSVDKQMHTNVPHIFAIGDIVGQPMLAHKATHEGKVAAEV
ncbi:MAG TPA: FAD-dependent oxidoreductase, partial [Luteimonas sp.]|nr:FAD-dependent oxidoreductase [Luteimonas sp.]